MNLVGPVYAAILLGKQNTITVGKTALQKIVFLALPDDEREECFEPYYYGPYSKIVQVIASQLVEKKYISYDESLSVYAIEQEAPLENVKVDSAVLERLKCVAGFLRDKGMCSASKISFFSKMYYFVLHGPEVGDDLITHIKDKSRLFNWSEVVNAHKDKIIKQLNVARELHSQLAA